ncbi:MAG: DEAD/DEAH box helicase [Pseudomonadota bacterium]|nr:DEAD/DEAH box helicase [Pseudomonadota bacterium]
MSNVSFAELGLSDAMLSFCSSRGFEKPTPIQSKSIPLILKTERDGVFLAPTGTGKTAAFGLPLLDKLDSSRSDTQICVLVPTRELAMQVTKELTSFNPSLSKSIVPIYGGGDMRQQLRALKEKPSIVVGTPGRIMDHLSRKSLVINNLSCLVLDEADEMLNMGFVDDIETILEHVNADRRILLFSATMPKKIRSLIKKYLSNPETVEGDRAKASFSMVEQIYYDVAQKEKRTALTRIFAFEQDLHALVFAQTRREVDFLAQWLQQKGYKTKAIHGDIPQKQRELVLKDFREKKIRVLIATDVAARGIDIPSLTLVVNYDLPQNPEAYVHRIGRTGRAGQKGRAVTLVTSKEYRSWSFIQRIVKFPIKKKALPSAKEVSVIKKNQFFDDLCQFVGKCDHDHGFKDWAQKLLADNEPDELVAMLMGYCYKRS